MSKYHSVSFRVYMEDTDAGGIMYHSNYLKFGERGRTDSLRALGGSLSTLQEKGMLLVVRSCLLNCLAPAHLNDVLEVRTHYKKPGRAKLEVSQAILREDQIIATLEVVLACINPIGKPIRLDVTFANNLWTHFGGI
ncbi:MAG: YbgC/FadM family acyl-CoA thioesterase [Alphaproteobacteria bacterium]|nr:YbgC/FadM family acyl-CoA thioesterase [Alphaproteobacteria bacterium]